MKSPLIKNFGNGFQKGTNRLTTEGQPDLDTGIDFDIYIQDKYQDLEECHPKETVWVLLNGKATLHLADESVTFCRSSIFDEAPSAISLGPETAIKITPESETVEWARIRAQNMQSFSPKIFTPENLQPEFRGKGLVDNTCLRNVRLIFDKTNHKDSNLVVGEVINLPGRWSSYPPHHHPQSEIYHYRFSEKQGYGHAELGEDVYKIHHNDTIKILKNVDHSQCAAPGYGMYYLWIVKHLKGKPYLGFEYTKEHEWILDENKKSWMPKEFAGQL